MTFPETPEDWFPGFLQGGDRLCLTREDEGMVLDALGAVEREAKRRRAGHQPDRRFDLALDVLGDLNDILEGRPGGD